MAWDKSTCTNTSPVLHLPAFCIVTTDTSIAPVKYTAIASYSFKYWQHTNISQRQDVNMIALASYMHVIDDSSIPCIHDMYRNIGIGAMNSDQGSTSLYHMDIVVKIMLCITKSYHTTGLSDKFNFLKYTSQENIHKYHWWNL